MLLGRLLIKEELTVTGVPVKGDDGFWRFPTESVAALLAEELVIGPDSLRMTKVVYAPTLKRRERRTFCSAASRASGDLPTTRRPVSRTRPVHPIRLRGWIRPRGRMQLIEAAL